MNQEEVWKKIEGFLKYEVSNRGNIRNIKLGRILRGNMNKKGYFVVQLLTEDQQRIAFPVHNLVAQYFIYNPNSYTKVGHIDRDLRNNSVENLRWETCSQIIMKKRKQKQITSSIYKGVSFRKRYNKWQVQIQVSGKSKHLGTYESEIEAARAYDEAAKIYFKEFARLNFEDEGQYNEYIKDDNDNKCQKQKTSIYRGVTFRQSIQKWGAKIIINQRNIYLGYFDTELEAAKAYDEAAKREYKELAVLNLKEDESNNIEIKQKKEKSSIYRDVLFHKLAQKWQAHISLNKVRKNLGLFKTELEAAQAYDKAAKELHKQFAKLNFKDEEKLEEQFANLNINEVKDQQ